MRPFLILIIIVITFSAEAATAGKIDTVFRFSARDLEIKTTARGVLINLPDAEPYGTPGAPALPKIGVNISLPEGTKATGLNIIELELETLPGTYSISSCQPPAILSSSTPRFVENDPAIYNLNQFYPEDFCSITGQGVMRGKPLVSLLLTPVQFLPSQGKLRLVKRLKIEMGYEKTKRVDFADNGPLEHLIVTNQEMEPTFQRLSLWRQNTGLSSKIRQIEWITENYPGRDNAEKLRTYLQICARDSGLKFLLLGGDTDIIPFRKAFAFACSARLHPREDSLPCDLYFSDLDGTWDENHNGVFGEVFDAVDLYPDIYVGRAPVNSTQQAEVFVNKILNYENSLYNDYLNHALFSAAVLWNEPYTDEAIAKERIKERHLPSYYDVLKLYESQMTVTIDTALALLNSGSGIFNHCGHGWIDALGLSQQATLRNHHIDGLANLNRQGIGYSIGCWTNAFDFDAIAEHFVLNPNGGGVAFIGNSSYGWGAPGNPGFGYSDRFDARFFYELFNSSATIGEILARTKTHFIPFSQEANVYRWHQFCLNLLGDPAMPVHTDTLAPLLVSKPLRLPTGKDLTRITVLDKKGPVAHATVTIRKENETFVRAVTGPDGTALLKPNCLTPGWARLFVVAKNHRPYQDSIPVLTGPNITLLKYEIIDSTGDKNGIPSPNETFSLRLYLKNTGTIKTTGLRCRISSESPLITIENNFGYLPGILPDSEITARLFLIRVNPNAKNGDFALATITFTDSTQGFWQIPLVLQVALPLIKIWGYYQNQNSDTFKLFISITNTGLATAFRPTGTIFKPDPSLPFELTSPGLIFPNVVPGETAWSLVPCQFITSFSSIRLGVNIVTNGYLFSDTLKIILENTGIFASFDSGPAGWEIGGINGTWSLSSQRFHSPPFSFYAGDSSGFYPDNCHTWLVSPRFIIPPNACLSFFRWFSVPTYGVDGLYVVICKGDIADTLDFIGSGGALGARPLGLTSEWLNQTYDLSHYPAGESCRLKFIFVSDNDGATGEGFYLDDIRVYSLDSVKLLQPETTRILGLFPNPVRNRTTVFFSLAQPASVRLAIFDPQGRMVKSLISEQKPAGYYSLAWDGTDDKGRSLPAGVYFLRLLFENLPPARIQRKIVRVK